MRTLNLTLSVCAILFLLHSIHSSPAHAQSKFIELEFEVPVNVNHVHPDAFSISPNCIVCLAGGQTCFPLASAPHKDVSLDVNRSANTVEKLFLRAERSFLISRGWKNGTPLGWQCELKIRIRATNKTANPTQDKNAAAAIRAASDRPFNVVERGTVTVQ